MESYDPFGNVDMTELYRSFSLLEQNWDLELESCGNSAMLNSDFDDDLKNFSDSSPNLITGKDTFLPVNFNMHYSDTNEIPIDEFLNTGSANNINTLNAGQFQSLSQATGNSETYNPVNTGTSIVDKTDGMMEAMLENLMTKFFNKMQNQAGSSGVIPSRSVNKEVSESDDVELSDHGMDLSEVDETVTLDPEAEIAKFLHDCSSKTSVIEGKGKGPANDTRRVVKSKSSTRSRSPSLSPERPQNIDNDYLNEVNQKYEKSARIGDKIDDNLARLVKARICKPLVNDIYKSLEEKYNIPENCEFINPPEINNFIWKKLMFLPKSYDLKIQKSMKNEGKAMIPLTSIIEEVLKAKGDLAKLDANTLLTKLFDIMAFIGNAFAIQNELRRYLLENLVDGKYKSLCTEPLEVDTTKKLFGEDVDKSLDTLNKTSKMVNQLMPRGNPQRRHHAYSQRYNPYGQRPEHQQHHHQHQRQRGSQAPKGGRPFRGRKFNRKFQKD